MGQGEAVGGRGSRVGGAVGQGGGGVWLEVGWEVQ